MNQSDQTGVLSEKQQIDSVLSMRLLIPIAGQRVPSFLKYNQHPSVHPFISE